MDCDNLGYRLRCDRECVVGLAESLHDWQVGIYLEEALVVDDEERIDILLYLLHTVKGLVNLPPALKEEWYCDDAHCQYALGL